jgi:hypothetical protein
MWRIAGLGQSALLRSKGQSLPATERFVKRAVDMVPVGDVTRNAF